MTDESPYETEFIPVPIGENVATFHEDGSVTVEKRPTEATSSIWKGARKILALPDETIRVLFDRKSGIIDYSVNGTHVSWGHGREKQGYLCHRHAVNRCAHTKRLDKWRGENFA